MNNNLKKIGLVFSLIFFTNEMTLKFMAGFLSGIYVSTKYDFKPYINIIENKVQILRKELEKEFGKELEKEPKEPKEPGKNWPWS